MYRYIFFDLDGTLNQSEYGIINSIIYALNSMGIEVEDPESIKRFIGPPLVMAFKDFYGMSDEAATRAAALYRKKYDEGEMYNAPLYDGIEECLRTLHSQARELYVVTSKPTYFAERIVERFGLTQYFKEVVGPDIGDNSYSKAEQVEKAIRSALGKDSAGCTAEELSHFLMIGDRFYDIEGANSKAIASMGVLYGYGSEKELREAGATYIAETPKDIERIILSYP